MTSEPETKVPYLPKKQRIAVAFLLFWAFFYHLSSISRALSKKRDKTVAILRLLSYFYHLLIHKRAC